MFDQKNFFTIFGENETSVDWNCLGETFKVMGACSFGPQWPDVGENRWRNDATVAR